MAEIFETEKDAEQAQRVADLLDMRKREGNHAFPTFKYQVINVITEMNIRLSQYVQQLPAFTLTFLINQTLEDFNEHVTKLQRAKGGIFDGKKPIALRKATKDIPAAMIYFDIELTKEDYKGAMPFMFSEQPK